jgi:DtxR family manganese transport transcriptional regulator
MELRKAKVFKHIRRQHDSESAEDYTELVHDLIGRIAEILGISHVTALRTVKRLCELGLLSTEDRKPVYLTQKGKRLAVNSKRKHEIVFNFLVNLGVPKDIAEIDSEGIEHHISEITLKIMEEFGEKL